MGFFTWTDAFVEKPTCNQYGSYKSSQVIGYDGYAKVVYPDGSELEEQCYQGYGMFGGKDIYELVVDWNQKYLEEIFNKLDSDAFGIELRPVAIAFQKDGEDAANKIAKELQKTYPLASEWKRTIGIAIGCVSEEKKIISKYPIKITKSKKKLAYKELYPSLSTQ